MTPTSEPAAALRRLLEQLADGAAADDLSMVASAARRGGLDPRELAEIEAATSLALRVRRTLDRHRRREAELGALFDTASDLAALRDLGSVLQSIVHRARMLLGTDTAYLTLPDAEAGDTYMRTTDGSVSVLFQSLRLGLGEGLGGLVAQTARPYASPDYRTDERFHHTNTIDAGVLDEGLVGILGVPLLLGSGSGQGGDVIGVLFAADRRPRAFSPDEVALLCSLAAHAAIAIDTAKALSETRAALTELADANNVIREHSAALQRAEEAHDRLTDLVLRGGEIPQVAAAVSELLGGDISVYDPQGASLATTEAGREDRRGDEAFPEAPNPPRQSSRPVVKIVGVGAGGGAGVAGEAIEGAELAAAVADSRATGRAAHRDGRWVCAVLAGQELLGSLVLTGRPQLIDPDRRLLERAAVVTALLLLLRRSVAEAENRVRGDLLTDLLVAPERDPAGLAERSRRLGIDLHRPHLLLVAETDGPARAGLASAATRYLFGRGGISAVHGGTVVLLLPADATPPGEAARAVAAHLAMLVGVPVSVGAAGPAAGPGPLAGAHAEAARCLRALYVLGRGGDGACAAELGFLGVLIGDQNDVDGFVTTALGPLLGYDDRRGTELVRTLRAYFASGGSLIRAKDELHVHVNTVVQRLDRIQALLGPDWNTPDRALELQLALRLDLLSADRDRARPKPESES